MLARIRSRGDDGVWIPRGPESVVRARSRTLAAPLRSEPEAAAGLPLLGIPFAAKDNINLAGMATTAGGDPVAIDLYTNLVNLLDLAAVAVSISMLSSGVGWGVILPRALRIRSRCEGLPGLAAHAPIPLPEAG